MFTLRAPSDASLAAFVAAQRDVPFSYPEVAASRGEPPPGYRVDRRCELVGRGEAAFDRARHAVQHWEMHVAAGVRVVPQAEVRPDLTVALVVRAAGLCTTSACRVVYRIDEAHRAGFAYGTLRDHPVAGEERFVVERGANDEVTLELRAFSRPSSLLFRLAGPVTRGMQASIGGAYIEALRRIVARS